MPLDCEPSQRLCPKCQVGAMEQCYGYTPEPHHQLGSFEQCVVCEWFDGFQPERDGTCGVIAVEIVELYPTPKATRARARAAKSKSSTSGPLPVYRYAWDRCGRKGQTCRLLARGTMNSCLLEFDDGFRMVTSRNALRRKST